jgi:endonuclease/exonuclease/phosphatase (EEP) superfamily protein YafD
LPITNHVTLVTAVASPYLLIAAPFGAIIFAVGRRWTSAILATTLTLLAVAVQAPLFVAEDPQSDTVPLRIMTANLYLGQADARSVVAAATARADVLAVQELTPDEAERMSKAGVDEVFRYRALDARDYASGGGLWSRYPIVESHHIDGYELAMVSARLRIDNVAVNPTVVVAHLSGPWPQPIDGWKGDLERMRGTVQQVADAAHGGCAIVAGDFNSTRDMKPFRKMLGDGFRDAAEQSGAGFIPTYPGNSSVPPFMAIDHVLVSQCAATSARAVGLPGSDHRGFVANVDVPRTPR